MTRLGIACAMLAGMAASAVAEAPRSPREEVRRMLAADFAALNRGELTLSALGEKACSLAETAEPAVGEVLLAGAVRIFARAGDTNGCAVAGARLDAVRHPFIVTGDSAVLRLGRFGELTFVRCPTGVVEIVMDMDGETTATARLTRPYWIMKYPLTRRESALYPPLDPASSGVTLDEKTWSAYVNPNRAMAEGLSRHFTERFAGKLPPGHVVRLPTLAEWEYAFHAGATEGDFADLRRIHHNDELGRRLYYDYNAGETRRKKLHNAWGIGDWCPQEKVLDVIDAEKVERGYADNPNFFLVQKLPPLPSVENPFYVCTNEHAASLIRMPSWVRWKAAALGFDQDWSPMRLVIAPEP